MVSKGGGGPVERRARRACGSHPKACKRIYATTLRWHCLIASLLWSGAQDPSISADGPPTQVCSFGEPVHSACVRASLHSLKTNTLSTTAADIRCSANTATQPKISIAPTSRADLFLVLALSQRTRPKPKPSPAKLPDQVATHPLQVAEPLPWKEEKGRAGERRREEGRGGRAGGREGEKAREKEERGKAGKRESGRERERARAREREREERAAASLRTWLYLSVQHIAFITHHTHTHTHTHTHHASLANLAPSIHHSRDAVAQVVKADDEAKANGKNGNCKLLDDANDASYPNTPGAQVYVYVYVYMYVYVYVRARACV